jgi:phage gpG-like protein
VPQAPGTVRVLVFGETQVAMNLRRGITALGDMKPALDVVADDMMYVVEKTFTGQGRRYGGSWAALNEQTIKRKAAKGQDPRINIATGRMMRAFSLRGSEHQVLRVGTHSIELDSDLDYPEFIQDGTSKMPARPFIDFYPQDRKKWAQICKEYLAEAMNL